MDGEAVASFDSESSPLPAAVVVQLHQMHGRTALRFMKFLSASGVIVGYFCRISAAAPEVMAAASLVPEPRK